MGGILPQPAAGTQGGAVLGFTIPLAGDPPLPRTGGVWSFPGRSVGGRGGEQHR